MKEAPYEMFIRLDDGTTAEYLRKLDVMGEKQNLQDHISKLSFEKREAEAKQGRAESRYATVVDLMRRVMKASQPAVGTDKWVANITTEDMREIKALLDIPEPLDNIST